MTANSYFIFHFIPDWIKVCNLAKKMGASQYLQMLVDVPKIRKAWTEKGVEGFDFESFKAEQKEYAGETFVRLTYPERSEEDVVYSDRAIVYDNPKGRLECYTVEMTPSGRFYLCQITKEAHSLLAESWKELPTDEQMMRRILDLYAPEKTFRIPEGVDALQALRDLLSGKKRN